MTWKTRPRSEAGALAAIVAGDGPLVLLLHGVGLRAEAWNRQTDALTAAGFRVIAPDMPGHGGSAAIPGPADLPGYTDLAAECLDAPAVVVGHSMGAMIALDLATRWPGRIHGVAALNAVFRRSPAARAAVADRAAALDGCHPADPSATLVRWFGDAASEARTACDGWLRAVDPAGYRSAYSVFATQDGPSVAALAALRPPALFVTGGGEPNATPAMSRNMAALTPDGRAEVIAGAAHMMPMTHPEAVNALLLDFARMRTP